MLAVQGGQSEGFVSNLRPPLGLVRIPTALHAVGTLPIRVPLFCFAALRKTAGTVNIGLFPESLNTYFSAAKLGNLLLDQLQNLVNLTRH